MSFLVVIQSSKAFRELIFVMLTTYLKRKSIHEINEKDNGS